MLSRTHIAAAPSWGTLTLYTPPTHLHAYTHTHIHTHAHWSHEAVHTSALREMGLLPFPSHPVLGDCETWPRGQPRLPCSLPWSWRGSSHTKAEGRVPRVRLGALRVWAVCHCSLTRLILTGATSHSAKSHLLTHAHTCGMGLFIACSL